MSMLSEAALRLLQPLVGKQWLEEPHKQFICTSDNGSRVWIASDGGSLTCTVQTVADANRENAQARATARKSLGSMFDAQLESQAWRQ